MEVINQVSILLLLMIVGYIAKRLHVVSDHANKDLSNLIMKVSLPAFIVSSMNYEFSKEMLKNSITLIIMSACIYGVIILITPLIMKALNPDKKKVGVYGYVLAFSNVAYMGYPIIGVVYGSEGVFYTAMFNLAFNLLTWTYGVYLMTRDSEDNSETTIKDKMKRIFNPGLIAVIIGFIIFLFSIDIPTPIQSALASLGSITTPLSMLIIGFLLSEISVKDLYDDFRDYVIIIFRLIIFPVVTYLVISSLGYDGMLLGIPVLIVGMPAAVSCTAFAELYGNDSFLASKLMFTSTLLSIITIPIFMMILS